MKPEAAATPGPKDRANECPVPDRPQSPLPPFAAVLPLTQRTRVESQPLAEAARWPFSFRHHPPQRRQIGVGQTLVQHSCLTTRFHLAHPLSENLRRYLTEVKRDGYCTLVQ